MQPQMPGLLSPEPAAGIRRVKGVKQLGFRSSNWLSAEETSEVLQRADGDSICAKHDYAMLAMLFGGGFRRSELVGLELNEIEIRQGHGAVVDLIGKGGHIRTVPIPQHTHCEKCGKEFLIVKGVPMTDERYSSHNPREREKRTLRAHCWLETSW